MQKHGFLLLRLLSVDENVLTLEDLSLTLFVIDNGGMDGSVGIVLVDGKKSTVGINELAVLLKIAVLIVGVSFYERTLFVVGVDDGNEKLTLCGEVFNLCYYFSRIVKGLCGSTGIKKLVIVDNNAVSVGVGLADLFAVRGYFFKNGTVLIVFERAFLNV